MSMTEATSVSFVFSSTPIWTVVGILCWASYGRLAIAEDLRRISPQVRNAEIANIDHSHMEIHTPIVKTQLHWKRTSKAQT
jgi:hypothetical protein